MSKICCEVESYLDYYSLFKNVMKYSSVPMDPMEADAPTSSAVLGPDVTVA